MGHILKPRLGLRLNHRHPLAQGLVGCWLMNEGTGSLIHIAPYTTDQYFFGSGNSWIFSEYGSALNIVANSTGGIEHINPYFHEWPVNRLDLGSCFAIVRSSFSGLGVGDYPVFATGQESDNQSAWGFGLRDNRLIFHCNGWSDYTGAQESGDCLVTANKWARIGISHRSATERKYLLDGVLYGPQTQVTIQSYINYPRRLSIGRCYKGGSYSAFFGGDIALVMVWKRALTDTELLSVNNNPYAMFEPDTGIWLRYYEAGGGAIIKVINETLQFSESVNKSMVAKKIINETLQLSESTLKLQDTKKVVNETLQLSESVEKKGATKKVVNETLQLSENTKKISGITKVINETLQIAESIAKVSGIVKVVNEVLQLSENIFKKGSIKKVVNETLQFSEALSKKGSIKKVVNEVLQLSENVLKKGSIKKVVNETLQLAENIVKKSGIIRIINEVLNISEGIIKALAVAYGWREVIEGDSPITLVVSGTSTITTEITGNSPLN